MKTERRHDLETNDLARITAEWIEKLKPHASTIFGSAIVVFGLLILISYWGSGSNFREQGAWDKFAKAYLTQGSDQIGLQEVATDEAFVGSPMQDWAQVTWADQQTAQASGFYFTERDSADELLTSAAAIYEGLIDTTKSEEIRNRSRYGLGRVYELQNRLDEAITQYDSVAGTLQMLAENRSEELAKPETKESYEWLSKVKISKPSSGSASGTKPAFEAPLPTGGLEASSVEDILGLGGDSDETEADSEVESESADKTEQPVLQLDDIFMDEGTDGDADSDDSDSESSTDEEEAAEAAEEAEIAEP